MTSNLEKYKKDLEKLISQGEMLHDAMYYETTPAEFKKRNEGKTNIDIDTFHEKIPSFKDNYQSWYSEALSIIKLLLPDRVEDFIGYYKKPRIRKSTNFSNYVIEDYLQGLKVSHFDGFSLGDVGPEAGIPQFTQQLNILKSAQKRFESSLFDIEQLIQADLFDSELEAANELNMKGFYRGAGAIAGVVLEKHLIQICKNHQLKITKKTPGINDFNQILKDNDVIDITNWRFIQRLGDLRNLCDHKKPKEPSQEDVQELIDGVDKVIKRIF